MIVVAGENVIDLVPDPSDPDLYHAHPGGGPANVAVATARLGTRAALLARVSHDVFGRRVRQRLAADGVLDSLLVAAAEPSALAVVSFDEQRRASYDFWLSGAADWQWSDDELPATLDPSTTVLHCGTLAAYLSPGAEALERLADRVRGAVVVSFDPNVRPTITGGLDAARVRAERWFRRVDLVKASDDDLAHLYPDVPTAAAARTVLRCGAAMVVVTTGRSGALCVTADGEVSVPAPAIEVVDTVGAGDTFMGALLDGLERTGVVGAGRPLAEADLGVLAPLIGRACAAAALNCARPGADPPTAIELDALF
jgi:fructokinase